MHKINGHNFGHNKEITKYKLILYYTILKSQTEKTFP